MSDSSLSRRQMLLGTAFAGAAAATADAAGSEGTPAEAVPHDPRKLVLPDNSHTRTYYALARD